MNMSDKEQVDLGDALMEPDWAVKYYGERVELDGFETAMLNIVSRAAAELRRKTLDKRIVTKKKRERMGQLNRLADRIVTHWLT